MNKAALFYINGKRHTRSDAALFQPLATFLRDDLRLTGTKVVCAEGACGACTVLVGRPEGDGLTYQPLNSCLLSLYQMSGCHVVTVEGVARGSDVNPVQAALIAGHGAQCGFCTPGMVMTLTGACEADREPEELADVLTGNLCRCTGYLPILESARRIDREAYRSLAQLYPDTAMAEELRQYRQVPVEIETGTERVCLPTTLAEAVRWKQSHPSAVVVAGGTELGVQWAMIGEPATDVLCLAFLMSQAQVCCEQDCLVIDACACWTQVEKAARQDFPELARLLGRFAGPQIKNVGTVGGQIVQASPIGDALPMLSVLGARVQIMSVEGRREVSVDAFLEAGDAVLAPGELVSRVTVPLPRPGQRLRLEKVSRRQAFDRSVVSAALLLTYPGETIQEARLAFGGLGPRVRRVPRTEAFLVGKPLTESTLRQAGDVLRDEITPPNDARGGAEYRSLLAANLLLCLLDEREDA
jgi:xanthine dehydrogenase small subunit